MMSKTQELIVARNSVERVFFRIFIVRNNFVQHTLYEVIRALNNAIAKCLIDGGYTDIDFISRYTNGFDELVAHLNSFSLQEAVETCGVPLKDIQLAAKYIGESKGFISMWAMGLNQSVVGVDKNLSLINLSLITGKIGKPGSGPFSLTGQPNAMGGREVGGMSNLLPAHRDLANPAHRKEIADFWGVESLPDKPGYTATEMFKAVLDDKVKVLWIICTNPLVSLPNSNMVRNNFVQHTLYEVIRNQS